MHVVKREPCGPEPGTEHSGIQIQRADILIEDTVHEPSEFKPVRP